MVEDLLLLANTLGVGLSVLHHRLLAKGIIVYPVMAFVSLVVALVDGYAAIAHAEQRSFILWALLGLWGLGCALAGWRRFGACASHGPRYNRSDMRNVELGDGFEAIE